MTDQAPVDIGLSAAHDCDAAPHRDLPGEHPQFLRCCIVAAIKAATVQLGPSWSEVEGWLKARRDEYADGGALPRSEGYEALDDALDDLREHMHTGTPLGRPVQRTEEAP